MAPKRLSRHCTTCGETEETQFYPYRVFECKRCLNARTSARQRGNKTLHWTRHLKRAYGLTPMQYDEKLVSQNGLCALCGRPFGDEKPMVDHNHETKIVRGLVHRFCNSLLGFAEEDEAVLLAAIEYIRRHKKKQEKLT